MKTLTTGEAAALCGVNFRTVIRWIEKGLLNAHRLPGRGDHRIVVDDFVEFLESNDIPIPSNIQSLNENHVLVIDDQLEVTQAYARTLKRAGYKVDIVNDGFRAGVKLLMLKPNLIILDLKMPGVDGYSILDFVRNESELKRVKIIVASGAEEASLKKAMEAGANVVLSKPFTNVELIKEVKKLSPLASEIGAHNGL